jgi:hypothetical protein
MAEPELEKTPQGFELRLATNFLGHFALTIGLHMAVAAANGARVVSVSSTGHHWSAAAFPHTNGIYDISSDLSHGVVHEGQSEFISKLLEASVKRAQASASGESQRRCRNAERGAGAEQTGLLRRPVMRLPTQRNFAATADPNTALLPHVIEEPLQPRATKPGTSQLEQQ